MAKYSVELYDIVKSGTRIFDFPYVFYDDERKEEFEQKFINHFRFREIGSETVGRFQHYLKVKCDEVLPYYNMLFRTALIDYEKLINYYLDETFIKDNTKNNDATGISKVEGSNNDEKISSLDSSSRRDENIDSLKNEDLTEIKDNKGSTKEIGENKNKVAEIGEINVNNTQNISNKKVESDTPTALLKMENIKANVYASKADIEDNEIKNIDIQKATNNKTNDTNTNLTRTEDVKINTDINGRVTEDISHRITDDVNTTNKDTSNSSFLNNLNTNNKSLETLNETHTRLIKGNVGVRSDAEMLQKHIELQKTLTTIYSKFFNECEDLFMQIF